MIGVIGIDGKGCLECMPGMHVFINNEFTFMYYYIIFGWDMIVPVGSFSLRLMLFFLIRTDSNMNKVRS